MKNKGISQIVSGLQFLRARCRRAAWSGGSVWILALVLLLSGCDNKTSPGTAWLVDDGAAACLIVNERHPAGTHSFRSFPLPWQPKTAGRIEEFAGRLVGAAAVREREIFLFFHDGTVIRKSAGDSGKELSRILTVTDSAGVYLTAAATAQGCFALREDSAGRKEIRRLHEKKEGENGWQWQPAGVNLPFGTENARCVFAECDGRLLVAWRKSNLTGWQAAVLGETPAGDPVWQWLPSPPRNDLQGAFAVGAAGAGILLAQEDLVHKKIVIALFSPARNAETSAIARGEWKPLALTQFPEETFSVPASSLSVCTGARGMCLARADARGVRLLAAPRFPQDPGAECASPYAFSAKSSDFNIYRILWWVAIVMMVLTFGARRWIVKMASENREKPVEGLPEMYREAVQDLRLVKTGGLASVFDRALAMMIDGGICLAFPAGYLLAGGGNWEDAALSMRVFFLWLGGLTLYSTFAELIWKRTPGKALLRMRVRHAEGGRPENWRILVRNLLRFIDFFPFVIGTLNLWYLVAVLFACGTRRTQRLGDLLAGTVVRYHCPLKKREIVLASASPQRKVLLGTLGLPFTVSPSAGEEFVDPRLEPPEVAIKIAGNKARAVAEHCDEMALVIAADTIVVADNGEILGKPRDDDDARRMLRMLSGRRHTVITAVELLDNATGQRISDCAFTELLWKELSDEDIEKYLLTGEHRGRAGAYGIQGAAARFTEQMDGSLTNVIGLPLELLADMLEDLDG